MVKNKNKNKVIGMKIIFLAFAVIVIGILSLVSVSALIHITDCQGLQNMKNNLAESYVLDNNINCSMTRTWNGGLGFEPVVGTSSPFTGNFDGKGYNITGLYINRPSEYNVGLFGRSGTPASITNLGLIDLNVVGGNFNVGGLVGAGSVSINNLYVLGSVSGGGSGVGGLVGQGSISINNSYFSGSVSGGMFASSIGGLVGFVYGGGSITNSYTVGNVNGGNHVGGLVGSIDAGGCSISNSYTTGSVFGTHSGDFIGSGVGGLVGFSEVSSVNNSYATGNVSGGMEVGGLVGATRLTSITNNSYATGNVSGYSTIGGLIGGFSGQIINSYARGDAISTAGIVGGLVGSSQSASITNSYATGRVIATGGDSGAGGLVGNANPGSTITNSYATGSVTGYTAYSGGLVGFRNAGGPALVTNSYWYDNVGDVATQCVANLGGDPCDSSPYKQTDINYFKGTGVTSVPPTSSWDFTNIWKTNAGAYPTFKWQTGGVVQDSDGDGVPDGEDNCASTYNPYQDDFDSDGIGDLCDACPATPGTSCATPGNNAAGEVASSLGGSVTTPNSDVTVNVPAGALTADNTIVVEDTGQTIAANGIGAGICPDVCYGWTNIRTMGPSPITFNQPVEVCITFNNGEIGDCSSGLWGLGKDVGEDGMFESLLPQSSCEDLPGNNIKLCGTTDSFSNFAVIFNAGAPYEGDWVNHDVTADLVSVDNILGCGLQKTYFCVDSTNNCNPIFEGNSVAISNDGVSYVRYRSVDLSGFGSGISGLTDYGNVENTKVATVKIDKSVPETIISTDLYNVNFILLCSDNFSGCGKSYYCLDNTNTCTPDTEYTGIASYAGFSYVRYYSVDNADNIEDVKSETICIDADGDNHRDASCGGDDCNDNDAAINPDAQDYCDANANFVDLDCDLSDTLNCNTYCGDADADGYVPAEVHDNYDILHMIICIFKSSGDCNDANAGVHPGAAEICDGSDNDCNGIIDDGSGQCPITTYYCDADSDGFVSSSASGTCNSFNCIPAGCFGLVGNDCNDNNAGVKPSAVEICNGIDDNCNNVVDETDADKDGVNDCSGADKCLGSAADNILLNPNQYAQNNLGTSAFESGSRNDQSLVYNMVNAKGCTCKQIVAKLGLGEGQITKGCAPGIMQQWTGLAEVVDRKAGVGKS